MKTEKDFERFQQEVSKLKSLLDDPQFGMFTWHSFLDERMGNIVKLYYGEDAEVIGPGNT